MSNNTSNYQEYTFSKLLEQYDKILVPMIQRDYAQGRTDKKASDVRNNLLNDIFSGNEVHFDLVFGSKEERIIDGKEMNCFIPVDGQQRLTTLFLLYLYGQKAGKTNTKLDLSKFSYDTRRAASDFCKSITSEEWDVPNDKNVSDVIKDSSWFMNYWEKDPTVGGMLNMLDAIHGKCKEITVYPNLDNVTFFLFDLESNGLNENLYLKMNSRGKPLTAFENLKAKIEKVLPDNIEVEEKCFPKSDTASKENFKERWKYFMDRDWTEAFWNSETPEKYDESITKFIVRFLSGYWTAYGEDKEKNTADELKSFNSNENYNDFVPFEPIKAVLELDDAFPSLAYALTIVPQITPYWSNDTIKVSDKSEYKFLAVIFTYVLFDGDKDAMRFSWNMAENYIAGYETFITYCKQVKEIREKINFGINKAFYKTLLDNKFPNPSGQLKEEIAKSKQILSENGGLRKYTGSCKKEDGSMYQAWEEIIIDAEKYAFFKGAIRFLFCDADGEFSGWNNFDTKWENTKSLIPLKTENCHTIKLMIPFMTDEVLRNVFSKFYLSNKDDNLKSMFLDSFKELHNFFMQQNQTASQSLLQRDLMFLCEQHPDYWIHKNWVEGFDVLSNYERQSGNYENNSYVVGNVFFVDRLNFLKKIEGVNISDNQNFENRNRRKIWKGLFIEFEYRSKKFRWQLNDWVDMYDGQMNNLCEKGLHSHYMGDEKESFKDAESLKKELDRCVRNR